MAALTKQLNTMKENTKHYQFSFYGMPVLPFRAPPYVHGYTLIETDGCLTKAWNVNEYYYGWTVPGASNSMFRIYRKR